MKTVIAALNSKYIHSSLAPWYLKEYCGESCGEIKIMEFTINNSPDAILASIYGEQPDIAAFSCYIWNITLVLRLAQDLKKVLPQIVIILGGPEVSFESQELLDKNPFVDFIIEGEGERVFKRLLESISSTDIFSRSCNKHRSVFRDEELILQLDELPSPYSDEMLKSLKDRIVYFEASRGCPFSCSYCLSSTFKGVRYFSMERIAAELESIISCGVRQIKFVDRTFNCRKDRMKEIFSFITERGGDTNFHFEVAADLFDDEIINLLSLIPQGKIQFEIGIQTTYDKTLTAVGRATDLEKAFSNIKKLREMKNIHLHLDLIAGLPFEDISTFKNSFNEVYSLKPHQLQLGFLKMLKGSKMRKEAELHLYNYKDYPPYEILSNKYLSYSDVIVLKGVEEIFERYYNSKRFPQTIGYLVENFYFSPFDFYYDFYRFNLEKGYLERPLSMADLYNVLFSFLAQTAPEKHITLLKDILKLDYLSTSSSGSVLSFMERDTYAGFKEMCFEFLKDNSNIMRYIPHMEGMAAKNIYKKVHFEIFKYNIINPGDGNKFEKLETVVLFDYTSQDKVTGAYNYHIINRLLSFRRSFNSI